MSQIDDILNGAPEFNPNAAIAKPKTGKSEIETILKDAPAQARGFKGWAQDIGATAVKGAIGVPEMAVGLADLATGGAAGKFLENEGGAVGFRPKQAKDIANSWHSDATLAAQRKLQEAEGIGGKFQAAIENPSNIVTAIGESLPSMGAGGVAARGLLATTRLGAMGAKGSALAGAAGEGITMAGSQAEQIRQETDDGYLTGKQSGLAAATGVAGGVFGAMGGKLTNKLGIGDADTMIAQGAKGFGSNAAGQSAKSIPKQVIQGAISEGLLEELPQSVTEQILQNLALGKNWSEGVDSAIVLGTLSGGAMGAGAAGLHGMSSRGGSKKDAAPGEQGPTLQLGNTPDPLIGFPDGTVARQSEVDAYINSLPEQDQIAARAKVMGMGAKTAPKREALPAAPELGKSLTGTDPSALMGQGQGLSGSTADPLANMMAGQRADESTSVSNIQRATQNRPPMTATNAGNILVSAKEQGLDLTVAPHPDGGFAIVPRAWVTPQIAAQTEAQLRQTLSRVAQAEDSPVQRAARTSTNAADISLNTDSVEGYIADMRKVNTPAAKAFVGEVDAGRITRQDVEQRMAIERGKTPDQRLAEAAAQAPAQADPYALKPSQQMGLNPNAGPMSAGAVIAVDTGAHTRVRQDAAMQQAAELAAKAPKAKESATQGTQANGTQAPQAQQTSPQGSQAPTATNEGLSNGQAATAQTPRAAAQDEGRSAVRGENAPSGGASADAGSNLAGANGGQASSQVTFKKAVGEPAKGAKAPRGILAKKAAADAARAAKSPTTGVAPNAQEAATTTNTSAVAAPEAGRNADSGSAQPGSVEELKQDSYEAAKARADAANSRARKAGEVMNSFHRGPMGLTTDEAKKTPEWIAANAEMKAAMSDMQSANSVISKRFAKESRADRDAQRAEKLATQKKDDGSVQDQPSAAAGAKTQAAPDQARTDGAGNAATASGVPAKGGTGDVQADGLTTAANQAATSPKNDLPMPTEAQKEAGNYQKGHARIAGHDIAIENPAGSKRRPEWPALKNHYGYFKGSVGADKDHVDTFMTDRADDASLPVFVVDQNNRDGSFDEHKVILGAASEAEARATYLQNYEKGWTGLGAITQMTQDEFKAWVKDPKKTKKPAAAKKPRGVLAKLAEQKAKDSSAESKSNQEIKADTNQQADEVNQSDWSEGVNGYTKRPVYRYVPNPRIHWAVVQNPSNGVYVIEYKIGDAVVSTEEFGDRLVSVKFHVSAKISELNAKQASHQDPGEKPEAATKGVVNDSLRTAAKSEDVKPNDMRKWLLAEIDKELLQAPDRPDFDEAVKRMGEKDAISMFTGTGFLGKNSETGFITFDIPGDGKFKVRNSVRGLLEFRKNVSSSDGFKNNGQRTLKPKEVDGVQGGSVGRMTAINNMIDEGDFEAARDYSEAVGISLDDVKVPKGERKPQWETFRKDGTLPPPIDTRPTATLPNTEKLSDVIDKVNAKYGGGLTEADRVPGPPLEEHKALRARIDEGKASVDEYRAGFESFLASKEAVIAEYMTLKKDDLLAMISPYYRSRYKSETKGDVAEALFDDGVASYTLGKTLSYSIGGKDSRTNAIRKIVEGVDADQLAQHAQEVKEAREESIAARAKLIEAVKEPKTLDDFRQYIGFKVRQEGMGYKEARMTLTPEQRAEFDILLATESRSQRKDTKDIQKAVRVAGQQVDAQIIATQHTKKGHDVYVVQLAERVAREDYETLNVNAKKMGGYYSSFRGNGATPGFQFTDRNTAQAFVQLANGDSTQAQQAADARRDAFADDRSQSAVERLNEMADKLEDRADESLGQERKANTQRRARFAASAEKAANDQKAMAKTMRNIANAIESGKAQFLDRVRQKVQVEMLAGFVRTAQDAELRAKYPAYADFEKRKGQPPTPETADSAEFPSYTAFRSDLASLGRQLLEQEGTKKLGQQLMKVADDVTDAFNKFAKDSPGKLMAFRTTEGGVVGFSSKAAAEASIARSGYKGKALPYMVKRGEYTIILSPSEAINRGIWSGDGDKRITLTADFGSELVEKIGKAARRGGKASVPWQFERTYGNLNGLARMGLETPSEFRAALREFIGLKEQAAEADRVKQMERAMIGRAKDGLDFFPTPQEVADQMIDAAGIEPDMAVLEPSAGMGHIADRIRETGAEPDVIEMSGDRRELLEAKGYNFANVNDFMDLKPRSFFTYGDVFRAPDGTEGVMTGSGGMGSNQVTLKPLTADGTVDARRGQWYNREDLIGVRHRGVESGYDRIVMNPPFSDGRDIQHVQHAYSLLRPGGRIVALMGESAFTNQNKRATEFRAWLEEVGGTEEKLGEGSFMDPSLPVNTGANARMVVIEKPHDADQLSIADGGAPFFSALSREIEQIATKSAPAVGWQMALQGMVKNGKIKADELEWSGLTDWLKLQEGKVSKEQVTEYLDANGVQVTETVLSSEKDPMSRITTAVFGNLSDAEKLRVPGNQLGQPNDFVVYVDGDAKGVYDSPTEQDAIEEVVEGLESIDPGALNGTKYSQYTLPGGTNYREVLLTLPVKARKVTNQEQILKDAKDFSTLAGMQRRGEIAPPQALPYSSSHWDAPNVLAHIRVNDRTDADGKKILFVEEIQSDMAQDKRRGKTDFAGPFIDSTDKWLALSLKRVIKMAVDGSYDRVAFVTGEQSAERYDLSKQIGAITATKTMQGKYAIRAVDLNDRLVVDDVYDADKLPDVLGKEIADKIVRDATDQKDASGRTKTARYTGLDLKVGGEGMKSFYDKIVPSALKDVLKKVGGGHVEGVTISTPVHSNGIPEGMRGAGWKPKFDTLQQPGFTITPAMIEKAAGGLPLFRVNDAAPKAMQASEYTAASTDHQKAVSGFAARLTANRDRSVNMTAVRPGTGKRAKEAASVASLAKSMFGREVVFVKFDGAPLFNGAVSKAYPGKVFINIESARPMMAVLGHELLHELRKSNPAAYNQLAQRLNGMIRNGNIYETRLARKYREQGIKVLPADIMEELHGDIVGDNFMDPAFWAAMRQETPSLFRQVAQAVQKWLDKVANMLRRSKTTNDGAAILSVATQGEAARPFGTGLFIADVAAARAAVAEAMSDFKGDGKPVGRGDALSVAAKPAQTESEAFRKWFSGSKVVDSGGNPLVVYHGTNSEFTEFDTETQSGGALGQGFYFAEDRTVSEESGIKVMQVNLSIKKPLVLSSLSAKDRDNWNDLFENDPTAAKERAIDEGFDGILDDVYTDRNWVAFKPEQIKSATGNNGNFNPEDPDIRFSIADLKTSALDQIKQFDVKTAPKNTWAHYRGMAMQVLGRRQIVELYNDELPQLETYNSLVQEMDAQKNESGAEADGLAQAWGALDKKSGRPGEETRLADLMHDATLAQMDPDKPQEPGTLDIQYKNLKSKFNALSPEAKALYRQARDMYMDHYSKVQQAIKDRIQRSEMSSGQKRQIMAKMDEDFFKKLKGVYFPLARFGQYVIVVKDANGEVKNVTRAETIDEAAEARKELLKAFPPHMGNVVGKVLKQAEFNAGRDAVGKGFMADLMGVLDANGLDDELRDTVAQLYLSSLPDLSWAKHGMHRKGTPGFSQDARRAFAQNMFHGAQYLAKLNYADQLQDQLIEMQDHVKAYEGVDEYDSIEAQQVVDEMVKRHEAMMSPDSSPVSTALTSFGFLFHMGLSPASAMVNLTQTALLAYPQMAAKWGYGKTSKALIDASAETVKSGNDLGKVLKGDELAAYERAVKDGTIDVTMAHDLAGISQGEDQRVTWKIRPAMRAASYMFHHAEKFNRQATFIAAYRLAKSANPKMNEDQLYETAKKATYDGHFDYASSNRARVLQGNWQKVIFLFKQYGQNMVYTLARNAYLSVKGMDPAERKLARKTLGGILAMHASAAGVLGLPLVGPLLTLASFAGGDDDEPWDAEIAMQNLMADMLGKQAAEVMAHGLSRLTPFDISGRVALDKLILPDVQEGLEGKAWADSAMSAALGPVAGIAVNMARGMQKITDGKYQLGFEDMMPTALRGPMKAMRYAMDGAVDKSGVVITDEVNPAGVVGQALGLSPSQVRRDTERRSAIYGVDRALMDRRSVLTRMFAEASMAGDAEMVKDIREQIQSFNEKNPSRRITVPGLMQSIRNRQKRIDESKEGIYLPTKRQDAFDMVRF